MVACSVSRRVVQLSMSGLLLASLLGEAAVAGEIKLSTVRIDLSDSQANMALIVTNVGGESSLVQFRVMAWSQAGAQDGLTVTRELIANPPMAEIAGGAQQVVRIGYNGKKQTATEGTYRLLVEEVPKKDREASQTIQTYLKLSVPIFIAPLPGAGSVVVPPTATLGKDAEGAAVLLIHNPDVRHLRVTAYHLLDAGGRSGPNHAGLFYILPGADMSLPLAAADPKPGEAKAASLMTDAIATPLQVSLRP